MSSDDSDAYTEFEPDVNEILFGQKTLPNRPLTPKEISKRKKIILKLIDQKLKFQLIGLLTQQQKLVNNSTVRASPVPIVNQININSNAMPLNYQCTPNLNRHHYTGPQYLEQNWRSPFQNAWQPPIHSQQYGHVMESINSSSPHQHHDFKPNLQDNWQLNQNRTHSFHYNHMQPNTNLIHVPTVSSLNIKSECIPTSSKLSNKNSNSSTNISLDRIDPHKKIPAAESSSSSVNETSSINKSFSNITNRLNKSVFTSSFRSSKMQNEINQQFFDDLPLQKAVDCTKIASKSTATNLSQFIERKRKQQFDSIDENSVKKPFLVSRNENVNDFDSVIKCDTVLHDKIGSKVLNKAGTYVEIKTEPETNTKQIHISDTMTALNKDAERNVSKEWNQMDELVTILCESELNHVKPPTESEIQLKKEILIQVSVNPDPIRLNSIVADKCSKEKLEHLINECKNILSKISVASPEVQSIFFESRDATIATLKSQNECHIISNLNVVKSKIKNIIDPLFNAETQDHELITKLIKNPHALVDCELMDKQIPGNNRSIHDVMHDIKATLDSFIQVREPETFHFAVHQHFDVPFVVNLCKKFGKLTEEDVKELDRDLNDLIRNLKVQPKPKLIEVKFKDGNLKILCANRMTFDWLKNNIPNHINIKIHRVKYFSKNKLKTICLKFEHPQFLHFNHLMEELKTENPRLFTQRWKLRSDKCVDSTKCMYVGVDIESLIILEEMNRVATLRKSLVSFEISYEEENFELFNFSKKKNGTTNGI